VAVNPTDFFAKYAASAFLATFRRLNGLRLTRVAFQANGFLRKVILFDEAILLSTVFSYESFYLLLLRLLLLFTELFLLLRLLFTEVFLLLRLRLPPV
jgi:hypothetical protein